jgi:hypothetical protein
MELDDYVDARVGVAVAATALAFSPRVRDVLRRGAVYGLAGAFAAGDALSALARGIGDGARRRSMGDRMAGTAERGDAEGAPEGGEEAGGATTSTARRPRRSAEPLGGDAE